MTLSVSQSEHSLYNDLLKAIEVGDLQKITGLLGNRALLVITPSTLLDIFVTAVKCNNGSAAVIVADKEFQKISQFAIKGTELAAKVQAASELYKPLELK